MLVIGTDPLHEMPILDLRLRKAVRHTGPRCSVASERPTSLDGGAEETARYAPGEARRALATLAGGAAAKATGRGDGEARSPPELRRPSCDRR